MLDHAKIIYDAMRATHRPIALVLTRQLKSGHSVASGAPIKTPETYYLKGVMFAVTGGLFDPDLVESGDSIILISKLEIDTEPVPGDRIAEETTPTDLHTVIHVKKFFSGGSEPHAFAVLVRK